MHITAGRHAGHAARLAARSWCTDRVRRDRVCGAGKPLGQAGVAEGEGVGAEDGGSSQLRIVAAQPVAAGREVHNTYGEYGNAALVYKHGFALRENPFDTVAVSLREVRDAVAAVVGDDAAAARMQAAEACLREAAGVAPGGDGGGGTDEGLGEMVKQLEICGADCAEAHLQSRSEVGEAEAGFVAFPLFAAVWAAGVDAEVVEAATKTEGLVAGALTEVASAAKAAGTGVPLTPANAYDVRFLPTPFLLSACLSRSFPFFRVRQRRFGDHPADPVRACLTASASNTPGTCVARDCRGMTSGLCVLVDGVNLEAGRWRTERFSACGLWSRRC